MIGALQTAATGMTAQQDNLDTIANNLANASTAGFRERRLEFQDLIYQNIIAPGSAATQQTTNAAGLQIGMGTRGASSEILTTQGQPEQTGNPLDLAIEGNGFFQIQQTDGTVGYTRAGNFHLDNQGNIVTADGDQLQPNIAIPSGAMSVTIGTDGTVSVQMAGQQQSEVVGQITLAEFPNPGGLESIGDNLMIPTTASGDPVIGTAGGSEGLGTIQQGMLEQSNVSVVEQFIDMIEAQQSYQANSKVVTTAQQMYQTADNMSQ